VDDAKVFIEIQQNSVRRRNYTSENTLPALSSAECSRKNSQSFLCICRISHRMRAFYVLQKGLRAGAMKRPRATCVKGALLAKKSVPLGVVRSGFRGDQAGENL